MHKHVAVFAVAAALALGILALGAATKPASVAGSWQVDTRHSAAQLITDGTTNYGKTKLDYTLGFARLNGSLKIDDDPTKSNIVFRFYPAHGMEPAISENGKFLSQWVEDEANHTLVCFHSKTVQRTADGRLQATGDLTLTRVDRNVQVQPDEAYSGPVYGPPIIHRVSREATFVFDLPAANGSGSKDSELQASASTSVNHEGFPQLLTAVVATFWPPVVQDRKCQNPANVSEDYRGYRCTGTFMEATGLPPAPVTQVGEDYSGPPSDFNAVTGSHLTILLHMRLTAKASGESAGGIH